MAEDGTLWFGSNRIQNSSNRLTLPPQTFTLEIARRGVPLHFFIEEETDRVAISKRLLSDGGRNPNPATKEVSLNRIDNNDVGDNRVVTIPKQFFPEFEGRAHGSQPVREAVQFGHGQQCHFVTTMKLSQVSACYLLKDERQIFEIVNEKSNDLIPDGSGTPSDSFEPPELDENEVLWIEEDEVISVDKAKSFLESGSSVELSDVAEVGEGEESDSDYSLDELESTTLELSGAFGKEGCGRGFDNFQVLVAVGHKSGYLGVAVGEGMMPDTATEKAKIRAAEEYGTPLEVGCGPQCKCGEDHTITEVAVASRDGLQVEIRPAPQGVGISGNGSAEETAVDTVETILKLAGVEDALVTVEGWDSSSRVPVAWATFEALCEKTAGSQFEARPDRKSRREDIF